MAIKCLEEIEREAKPENIAITMGYVGQVAPNFGIDNMVLFMRGPDDGQLRVALTEDSGIKLDEFRERMRKVLPERVIPWLAKRLEQGGLAKEKAEQQAKLSTFGFEPGDMVTTGHELRLADADRGPDCRHRSEDGAAARGEDRRQHEAHPVPARRRVRAVARLPDRRGRRSTARRRGSPAPRSRTWPMPLVMATASTRFASLNYWIDVKTGFDYLVQLQIPPLRIDKPEDIETLPVDSVNPLVNLMIRDVATVRRGVRPGEIDRDMSQRYVTLTANVEGEDMGRASRQVAQALAASRRAAPRRAGRDHGPAPADDRDVPVARDRAGGRRVRDPRALDRLLPVAAAGLDIDRSGAGRARGHRDHPLLHQHLAQHRVVHGLDHVPGRLGVELGDARDVHRRALEGRERRRPRRP